MAEPQHNQTEAACERDRVAKIMEKLSTDTDHKLPELLFEEFDEQQFQKLKEFYNVEKKKLAEVFRDNALEIHQVGSTAIRGMPGTREIDIIVIVQFWPPTDEDFAKMKEIGYAYFGLSPHYENDSWFIKKAGDNDYQDFGDSAVHVSERDNIGNQRMIAFVEYCNAVPEAAERYKQIKIEASKGSDFKDYKSKKMIKTQPLLNKALEWKQKQQS